MVTIEDLKNYKYTKDEKILDYVTDLFNDTYCNEGDNSDLDKMHHYLYAGFSIGIEDGWCTNIEINNNTAILHFEDEECDNIIFKLPMQSLIDNTYPNAIVSGNCEIYINDELQYPDITNISALNGFNV